MSSVPYIELLKKVLTDYHRIEFPDYQPIDELDYSWQIKLLNVLNKYLKRRNFSICTKVTFDPQDRIDGRDWPSRAETMIGLKRLDNLESCFNAVIENDVKGDFIETGVWRGGATMFMQALLKNSNITNRTIWVADSFEGLPKPDGDNYPMDKGDIHFTKKALAISLETVKNNFKKYGLLDDNVKFLKGWFKDTLPKAPIENLAILRLDGDMYESTMDSLVHLYPKLSPGGYIIIDDWGAVRGCKQAVLDYRKDNNIKNEIITIDWASVFWKSS